MLGLLCLLVLQLHGQIKRSRAEAMPGIEASNTMGFGNIYCESALMFHYRSNGASLFEPYQTIGLGLSPYLDIFAGVVPFEKSIKQVVGKADAHLKATLPGNDNLRMFGIAVQGDLVLSSEQDTVSEGQNKERPAFKPRVGMTIIADADLIKKYNRFPLKIYLNWSLFDNDRLLQFYTQQSIRAGVEYKGPGNTYFASFRYGLYKRIFPGTGAVAETYGERTLHFMPGVRFRVFNWLAVNAALTIGLTAAKAAGSPLYYEKIGVRFGAEFPLYHRETNAEAIRAMIYLDQKKSELEKQQAAASGNGTPAGGSPDSVAVESGLLDDGGGDAAAVQDIKNILGNDATLFERQKKIKEKRKEIQKELGKIEGLLEE